MMASVLARLVVAIGGSMEVSMLLKATVVLGLAIVAARCVPRARASARHVIFAAAFCVLLLLPMIAVLLPPVVIQIPMTDISDSIARSASLGSPPVAEHQPENGGPVPPTANRRPSMSMSMSMSAAFRTAWAAGILLFLIPFIVSLVHIRRIRCTGLVWRAGEPLVRMLAAQAGVRRHVRILVHDEVVAPMTCGLMRPAIVLPSVAAEWTAADVRQAVVHELEHVRRADWPIHLLARVVCAVYWFHPLVWMAWRHLCLESERACDDAVLGGADETAYAEQLVSLARRFVKPTSRHALSMAGQSDLSVRISAVLDPTQVRGRVGIVRATTIASVAVVSLLAISPLKAIARSSDAHERFLTSRTAAIGVDVPLLRTPAPTASLPRNDEPSRTSARVRPASTPSAQRQVTEATSSTFEVVSVTAKPSGQTDHKGPVLSGDELTAINTQLRWLIFEAYGIGQYQLSGGPEWISTDYFDVTAKARAPASREALRSMLRALLADRFHLMVHTEKRDTPIYALVVAAPDGTLGPNLHRGTADCATLRAAAGAGLEQTGIPCGMKLQIGRFAGRGFGLNVLAGWLSRDARRMVVDNTGLDGVFDFDLTYTPEQLRHHPPDRFPSVDPEGPSIFTAVEEQLGLKLEPQDSLGDVLVIDHVEQPTRD